MTAPIRVGVVGLRFGAQVHVPAFRSDPRCVVVGIAGLDFAKAAGIARDLEVPAVFEHWRQLVDAPEIDVVSIAVPPAAQADVVVEAARRGKHVFCEKPLAASLSDARRALSAVQASGIAHGIDFLFPELESWRRARSLLSEHVIGRTLHFAYTWRVETYASRTRATHWKTRPEDGGGALGNFASHIFYNIEWLLGPITAIEGFTCAPGARSGNAVDGVVELEGGASGTVSVSTDAFLGSGHIIEIYGDAGTLLLSNTGTDYANGFTLRVGTRPSPALRAAGEEGQPVEAADGRVAPASRLIRRFVDAVTSGDAMTPNLTHGVRVQELLSLAAESAGDIRRISARLTMVP